MVIKMLINKEAPVLSVEYTGRDIPVRTEIKDGTVICGEFVFGLQSKNGIFTPHIYSDTSSALKSIEIIYPAGTGFLKQKSYILQRYELYKRYNKMRKFE